MKKIGTAGFSRRAAAARRTAGTVTILLNQRCAFKCRHCSQGYSDSYRGERGALKPAALRAIIRGIAGSKNRTALLAGGEPALNPELIELGVRECAGAGLASALITAPVWARTPESAAKFLDRIAGLDQLILSFDQFHSEALPLANYRNAAAAAFARGLRTEAATLYLDEADHRRQLRALKPLGRFLAAVTARPVVAVGNAAALAAEGRTVRIDSEKDLAKLPATCSVGEVAYVDDKLSLHGCCWSPYGGPALDLPPRAGSLAARFAKLEKLPAFRRLARRGFIGSLSPAAARGAAGLLKGRRFRTECDLCMALAGGARSAA